MKQATGQQGFTLVELAIALVIIALLIGGMLAPLSTQKEQERRSDNQRLLEEAREALIGFAVVNGRLPCPDTDAPNAPTSGQENACAVNSAQAYTGRLPWATLGIDAETDPWGDNHFLRYTVNGAFTGNFSLTATGSGAGILEIHSDAGSCASANNRLANNIPALIWSGAKNDYSPAPVSSADEAENIDNDVCFVSRNYNTRSGAEFDDQLIWLSPNVLFNRMIAAGTLP